MNDVRLCFKKNRAISIIGIIVCIGACLLDCLLLAASLLEYMMYRDVAMGDPFAMMNILFPLIPLVPCLMIAVAGGMAATHHRKAYVTITEEGLTIRNVMLWGHVSNHRFTIKSGRIAGNILTLSIWDRSNPMEQRINLSLLTSEDANQLLKWMSDQKIAVQGK